MTRQASYQGFHLSTDGWQTCSTCILLPLPAQTKPRPNIFCKGLRLQTQLVGATRCAQPARAHLPHEIQQPRPSVTDCATLGGSSVSSPVLFLAEAQMARQNPILFTKSARLYTKLSAWADTAPCKYPKKWPRTKPMTGSMVRDSPA